MKDDVRPVVRLLERWRWIKQIAADRDLSAATLNVAVAIADKVNIEKGYAWPRLSTLEEITGLKERGIRGIVGQLVIRGHLRVKISRGPGTSNRYWLQLRDVDRSAEREFVDSDVNHRDHPGSMGVEADGNRRDHVGFAELQGGKNQHSPAGENRHSDSAKTGTVVPPIILSKKLILPLAPAPLELADETRLDPTDPDVMNMVAIVCRQALAARPRPNACNRGDALKRIRRRLATDDNFEPFRPLIETTAYRVGDFRRGVAEVIERRRREPDSWADFVAFVQGAGLARLDALSRQPRPIPPST